jgi:hypothetical protein
MLLFSWWAPALGDRAKRIKVKGVANRANTMRPNNPLVRFARQMAIDLFEKLFSLFVPWYGIGFQNSFCFERSEFGESGWRVGFTVFFGPCSLRF